MRRTPPGAAALHKAGETILAQDLAQRTEPCVVYAMPSPGRGLATLSLTPDEIVQSLRTLTSSASASAA
jgi:hypothetical protein